VKPACGGVSGADALALSFTLDAVGPLAVSAEDAGLIMGIIAGPDPLDPTTLSAPAWNAKRTRASPKGLRIGVPARFYTDDLESDIASALDATIAMLRKLGAKISKVELPDQTVVSAAALIVLAVEATTAHPPWLRTRAADYGPQVRNRLQNGLAYSAVEYLEALRWPGPALAAQGGRRHRYGHQLHRASGGSGRSARAHRQGFRRSRSRARGHRLRIRHLGWDGTRCRGYRVGEALLPGRGREPCLTVPVRLATPFSTQLRAIHLWRTSCEVSAGKFDPPGSELPIAPIFKAASVTLAVSREKDGKLRLVYAGWDERLLCWTSHERASALRPETVHCRSLI